MTTARNIFVVDIEATMFSDNPQALFTEIVQIGVVRLCLDTRLIAGVVEYLIKPQATVCGDALTELTGLTQQQLDREGLLFGEVCLLLRDIWGTQRIPWSSWGYYDLAQIQQCCQNLDSIMPFHKQHFDLKRIYWLVGQGGKGRPKGLRRALQMEGLEFLGQPHSAVDDAMNAARILVCMVELLEAGRSA